MRHLIEKASQRIRHVRNILTASIISLGCLFLAGTIYAGEIEEEVHDAIKMSNAQKNIAVIVRMVEQPDLLKMKQGFNNTRRRAMSSRLAGRLKEFASVKQGDIRKYLERGKGDALK
jgi:hypothetical protein